MESYTKLTTILSWFNLVIASILVLTGLISSLTMGSIPLLLAVLLLGSAIILHSYACLQLKKSIIHPEIPLGHQTPVGVRFMGYVALFFAFLNLVNSVTALQHTDEFVKQVILPANAPKVNLRGMLRGVAIFTILFSLTILLNVYLNLRLLRWYQLQTRNPDQK
ncbi:MAG: hypothetical protein C5B59_02995 [Bacteroidetes bacterium]|nr:MAG: hypothetical protein C5B59_02995 [Bacteroidota bacterium]